MTLQRQAGDDTVNSPSDRTCKLQETRYDEAGDVDEERRHDCLGLFTLDEKTLKSRPS